MSLRTCEHCNELFNAIDTKDSDTVCDFCANKDAELAADELLEQQELEDYENAFGPCNNYEDSYLDAFYEDRYEYEYGGEG